MRLRDEERQRSKEAARQAVGELSARELFLLGVGLYCAEGSKGKPYDRRENVCFVNSDPGMIQVFLAWLDLLGVERERLRFAVMIHESADVAGANDTGQNSSAPTAPPSTRRPSSGTTPRPSARTPARTTEAAS